MSQVVQSRRLRAVDMGKRKAEGRKIVALTAYHAHTAGIVDAFCDFILVGDSLGMVMHGMESTIPVTLEMMIVQGQAVIRGTSRALVVVDMPFGSYEASREQAFLNASRVLKETGAGAIKMEGGAHFAETVAFLVQRGIPVMGHIGLTPQAINTMGGFKVQGRAPDDERRLIEDARAISEAGAFAIVLEGIVEPVARAIASAPGSPRPRSASGRRRSATGRSWCWRTCSVCPRRRRNSSASSARSAPTSNRRFRPMPRRSAPAPSRRWTTPTGRRIRSSAPRHRPGRVADDRRPGGHVAGDDGARTDDRIVAHRDAGQNQRTAADPDIRPDRDGTAGFDPRPPLGRIAGMVRGQELHAGADLGHRADRHGATSRITQLKLRNTPSPTEMCCP